MTSITSPSIPPEAIVPSAARLAVPFAAYLAAKAFSAAQANVLGAEESAFLGLSIAAVLAAIAALEPPPARALSWTAVLATAVLWGVEFGPHRGAAVSLLLAAGLAVAAARRWRRGGGGLPPALTVPAALGLQVLARSELLLPPLIEARSLVSLLVLPLAAGLATSQLAALLGAGRAALAATAAFVLFPGWNVTTTLALVALAAGATLAREDLAPRALRWAAWAGLAAAVVLKPPAGALAAAAGLVLARWPAGIWLALGALALGAARTPPARGWGEAWELAAAGLLLLPTLLLAPGDGRRRVLTGVAVLAAGAVLGPGPEALAAGLGLVALGLPRSGAAVSLQMAWLGAWLAGTVLLAAYPWLRAALRSDALALLGFAPGPLDLLLALGAFTASALLFDRVGRPAWPRRMAWAILALALAASLPAPGTLPLEYHAISLSAASPSWEQPLDGECSSLVVDSSLVRSLELPAGTAVAEVELLEADGRPAASWQLRTGEQTAEWAAARADVAARPGFEAPAPWLSYLAPGGGFFGQRFRARFEAPRPVEAERVRIRRLELPEPVEVVLYRVETRP